jgi:hypothetical protein
MNFIISTASEAQLENWWGPLCAAAVGAVIGMCGSLFAISFTEHVKRDSERKRLAATLAGELEGIVAYLERHKVEELLEDASQSNKRPNVKRIPPLRGSFVGANSSLGLLPTHLASDSSSIVVHLRGTIEEFTTVRDGWRDGSWTDQEIRDFCKELASMVKTCKTEASKLIPELRKEAEIDRAPHLYPPGLF